MKLLPKFSIILFTAIALTSCSSTTNTSTEETVSSNIQNDLLIYGDVVINTTESINFDFPFKVNEIYVKDGQNVNAGDVLISLDLSDYMLQISSKENEIKQSKIKLQQLESTSNAQVASIKSVQENLSLKQSYISNGDPEIITLENNLAVLKKDLELNEQLYQTNLELYQQQSISKNELDLSELDYNNTKKEIKNIEESIKQLKSARSLEVNSLQNELKSLQAQSNNEDISKASNIELLQLEIKQNEAVLAQMKSKLNKPYLKGNNIVAPADNLVIYNINCNNGSTAEMISGPLLQLMYKDSLYATVDIPEEDLSLFSPGTDVSIKLADEYDTSSEIAGTITSISDRAIDKDGDTIVLGIIDITKGKELLKPGLSLDVTVPLN